MENHRGKIFGVRAARSLLGGQLECCAKDGLEAEKHKEGKKQGALKGSLYKQPPLDQRGIGIYSSCSSTYSRPGFLGVEVGEALLLLDAKKSSLRTFEFLLAKVGPLQVGNRKPRANDWLHSLPRQPLLSSPPGLATVVGRTPSRAAMRKQTHGNSSAPLARSPRVRHRCCRHRRRHHRGLRCPRARPPALLPGRPSPQPRAARTPFCPAPPPPARAPSPTAPRARALTHHAPGADRGLSRAR
jgi:hypothetical protein